jgi:FAD:protein FMN transferase
VDGVLAEADAVFSAWNPDSPVSRLRRSEAAAGEMPAEVEEVLGLCADARAATDGCLIPGRHQAASTRSGWSKAGR